MNRSDRRTRSDGAKRGAAASPIGHGWKTPSNRLRLLTVAVSLPLLVVSGVLLLRGQSVAPPPKMREETLFARAAGKERA